MQVAVLGLGRFGAQLVRTLSDQGHEVMAVDHSEAEVNRVAGFAAKAAIADIRDEEALRDLNVGAMDAAIVSTAVLEASVLATMNLQSLGVRSIYCKARSERHATILRRLGAERVVQPEKEGGERFAHLLRVRGARDYLPLTPTYGIGVYTPPGRLAGAPLSDVVESGTRRLLMVVRGDEVQLNPVRSLPVQANDLLIFAGSDEDLARDL
jgi:trk system potassium uptake protein TrkA